MASSAEQGAENRGSLNFYAGSRLLSPVADTVGLPVDQVNFISCQLLALLLGIPFRTLLKPQHVGPTVRHLIEASLGFTLTWFCLGYQTLYVLGQSLVCLLIMRYTKPGVMEKLVFFSSLGYLCYCHIYRLILDYGGYTLDITGPLMINTQRLSSMAYSLRDGTVKDETKLTPHMKQHAVKKFPTLLEFLSYVFSFHGAMCGPFCFYNDYIAFIEGTDIQLPSSASQNGTEKKLVQEPSPTVAVITSLVIAVICGLLTVHVVPLFPHSHIIKSDFLNSGFFYQTYYITISTTVIRNRYYFAWSLAEAVNNNAGLGFNGYDDRGRAKWDKVNNANIYYVELSTSFKILLDNWNKTTTYWLRHVVYERVPFANTWAVFMVSAFWHGFYPGYYLTFASGAIFILAGRAVRRTIRPLFQTSTSRAWVYDAITFASTRLCLAYTTFPFVLLQFVPSLRIYGAMFFWMHIAGILAILGLPVVFKRPKKAA